MYSLRIVFFNLNKRNTVYLYVYYFYVFKSIFVFTTK